MNTELDTDPAEEQMILVACGSLLMTQCENISHGCGGDPEKIEELIAIQREYEISMGKAQEEFEQRQHSGKV